MASLLDMLNRGGPGVPQRTSPLTAAVQQANAVQQTPLMRPSANRRSGPGLLDTIWGVAAGYSPNATRQAFDAKEQEAATRDLAMQQQQMALGTITDPRERAAFLANPEEWGKAQAGRFGVHNLARGAQLVGGGGDTIANNPYQFQSGDEIIEVGNGDPRAVYTRTAPSIAEALDQEKLRIGADQFRVTSDIARQNADTSREVGLGNLAVAQGGLGLRQAEIGRTQAQQDEAKANQAAGVTQTAQNMGQALASARRFTGSAGVVNAYNPLQAQNRANLSGYLDTLKGNLTFDKLMDMKANSPTGASGLGALSDNEARLLASTVAAMDVGMSEAELNRNLGIIDNYIKKMQEGATRAAPASGGQVSREAALAELRRRGVVP